MYFKPINCRTPTPYPFKNFTVKKRINQKNKNRLKRLTKKSRKSNKI